MKRLLEFFLLLVLATAIHHCSGDDEEADDGDPTEDTVYRKRMRDFVISLAQYARQTDAGFIVIPQNGHDLLSLEPGTAGKPAVEYIGAIDGMGQEDLLYGYNDDNEATPPEETEYLKSLLDIGKADGLQVLVTDYCSDQEKMADSYSANNASGYISFAADHRDLDNIPGYPREPYNANAEDVGSLLEAKNFLYLLDPGGFGTREAYLEAVQRTDFDALIIDAFYDDDDMLTREEVEALKTKANGGARLVISYLSIGEAEDYRYYFEDSWKVGDPEFIEEENPEWEGNFKVRYWDPAWQKVIFGETDAYLDRILAAGFDGAYLDIIEAFEHFE